MPLGLSTEVLRKSYPISFSAGPAHLPDITNQAIHEIVESGFLTVSHRSQEFSEVSRKAIEGMREKMKIPPDFHIFYQNSSTAAWNNILENLVKERSFHFVLGEFSERFYFTAQDLNLTADAYIPPFDEAVKWKNATIHPSTELIAITHNETRSGLMWPWEEIRGVREAYPEPLIAIDVCSSFGGMNMQWDLADIWLGSVQKCLGMPPGLGYIMVNERAMEKARKLNKKVPKWRKFQILEEQMKKYQTYETPNSLEIALLAILMHHWDIDVVESQTREKASLIYGADLNWQPFIKDPEWRSITCAHMKVDDAEKWNQRAEEQGFYLGRSFGTFASNGIRVANFPGHTKELILKLIEALRE